MPPEPNRHQLSLVTPGQEPGDDALMALANAGDQRAFASLVSRHETGIRRLAGLLIGDPERGRDLAQDAFVVAWERRGAYRPTGKLRAWLAGIVRNLAARERRRARVRSLFFGAATPPAWVSPVAPEDGFDTLAGSDRDRVLSAALQRIPAKMREALVLRFVEGLDYDAMAEATDVSASTLRSRVHHGLSHLRAHVPEELLR
jgi:RNA polymerase sigma-70 factor (ECF subfamily)